MTILNRTQSNFFLLRDSHSPVRAKDIIAGGIRIVGFNCSPITNDNDSTVSSVVWTSDNNNVALSASANANNTVQVLATTTASSGLARLKAVITFSDAQIYTTFIDMNVIDPEAPRNFDYRDFFGWWR